MENAALRSRVLHKIGSQLSEIAVRFKIAVGFIFCSPTIANLFYFKLTLLIGCRYESNDDEIRFERARPSNACSRHFMGTRANFSHHPRLGSLSRF